MMKMGSVAVQFRRPCLHSGEPDGSQSVSHFSGREILVLLAAEQLLDEKVVDHHSDKSAGCQQGVGFAKCSFADAAANVAGERFEIVCNKRLKEALRKFVVLKSREPEQAGQLTV